MVRGHLPELEHLDRDPEREVHDQPGGEDDLPQGLPVDDEGPAEAAQPQAPPAQRHGRVELRDPGFVDPQLGPLGAPQQVLGDEAPLPSAGRESVANERLSHGNITPVLRIPILHDPSVRVRVRGDPGGDRGDGSMLGSVVDGRSTRLQPGFLWRIAAFLAVAGVALAALQLGVDFSERPGVTDAGAATKLYYVVGLFFLGGLDLGMPAGGPGVARGAMWIAYFAAPVITTGAIIEGLLLTMRPDWWMRRGLRDHIVVVGAGRIGLLYMEAIREWEPHRTILLVALEQDMADVAEARTRLGARFVQGDITHEVVRASLRLDRAAGVVLLTRHDLVNLEGATAILSEHPELRGHLLVHVADLTLKRAVAEQWRRHPGAGVAPDRVFNSHRVAAEHLVREDLQRHFSSTRALDVVVLAGFGRFGQTILEVLQEEAADEVRTVVVVDLEAHKRVRQFRAGVGDPDDWNCRVIEGDISDPGTWDLVTTCLCFEEEEAPRPVYVLGTNSDEVNLHTAMWLRTREPDAGIVARCFSDSGFTDSVARDANLHVIGVGGLLRRTLGERHRRWFPEL